MYVYVIQDTETQMYLRTGTEVSTDRARQTTDVNQAQVFLNAAAAQALINQFEGDKKQGEARFLALPHYPYEQIYA